MNQAGKNTVPLGRTCAVIVTFNRKALLVECIDSVKKQTRKLDGIYVIDNHSTDGTAELIRERHPDVECVRQPRNRGSAGGFSAALELGYQRGYEWIWLLDDDIEVMPNTLEVMEDYQQLSKFIQVRREGPEGLLPLEAVWDASMGTCVNLQRDLSFERSDREWISVQWGNFEGPLIHRSVIENVGLPEERFFLSGDDLMYGYAASFYTNVIYLRYTGVKRKLPYPKSSPPLRWYMVSRNRFLIRDLLRNSHVSTTPRILEFGMIVMSIWFTLWIISNPSPNRVADIRALWWGLWDGWRGQFGPPPWFPKQ